jgi:hypothetical protein
MYQKCNTSVVLMFFFDITALILYVWAHSFPYTWLRLISHFTFSKIVVTVSSLLYISLHLWITISPFNVNSCALRNIFVYRDELPHKRVGIAIWTKSLHGVTGLIPWHKSCLRFHCTSWHNVCELTCFITSCILCCVSCVDPCNTYHRDHLQWRKHWLSLWVCNTADYVFN